MERGVQPLNESLGLPDVFPHLPGCAEDGLSAEALQHGYFHSEAAALGFDRKRELQLTLTDQPPAYYSPASLAYWRKALRQQLQGPARHLAAKRKAHVLYDVPLAGSNAASDGGSAATPQAAPRFPQQPSRGVASREAAEAWAQQQLAAPGAPPLRLLGWGGAGGELPHGFPRTRLIELLAELAPPLPRALWFLRIIALNRTRPTGWDGASEAQQRSRQLTEEVLGFLEASAPAPAPAQPAPGGRPPRPRDAGQQQRQQQKQASEDTSVAASADDGAEAGLPPQWQYGVRLAGHCCTAGLLDAAKVAEWAASTRTLLPLPAAGQRKMLALLEQSLPAAQLAQQQVLALLELCLRGSEAASAAALRAGPAGRQAQDVAGSAGMVQRGLLQAAALLLELHPAAFVAADEQLLQPLLKGSSGGLGGRSDDASRSTQQCADRVSGARQRLSQALHARVLHWHDSKAMELLDMQLRSGSSAAAAAAELLKLVLQQPTAASGQPALHEPVRLVCEWAAAAPAADFAAALGAAAGASPEAQQAGSCRGVEALLPERVLFGVALLQALPAEQQQQQQPAGDGSASSQPLPLQAALCSWLDCCAGEQQQMQWRRQRLMHLLLLLAEAGLFCPAAYLRHCLANGAFQQRSTSMPSTPEDEMDVDGCCGASCAAAGSSFHLSALGELSPLLEFPSLAVGSSNSKPADSARGGHMQQFARQQYAWARAAVLGQYNPSRAAAEAAASAEERRAAEWDRLLQVATPGESGSSTSSSGGSSSDEVEDGSGVNGRHAGGRQQQHWQQQQQQSWQPQTDTRLDKLQHQLLVVLGLRSAGSAGSACATASPAGGTADSPASMEGPTLGHLLSAVRQLMPWQQRHTAVALLAAAKAFLASTDSGGGGRGSPAVGAAASPPPPSSRLNPRWLLQALAVLRACGGHREALSLLATCLNVLQRAVAAAVRLATSGQQQQQQQRQDLAEVLLQAQQRWQQRSQVSQGLLLALLSAHAGSLAAADIAAKLLPMLTGGLWRLQQQHHQQAARQSLARQLDLAAQLLALPGSASQQWLDKMEQQHSSSHWAAVLLQQRAAACKAHAGGSSTSGGPQQLQQQAAACVQAFMQRAQELPAAGGDGRQPALADVLLQPSFLAATGPADAAAAAADGADMAALAAVQRSLAPAALPAVLQQLAFPPPMGPGPGQAPSQGQEQRLQQQLLAICPSASQALLSDTRLAHAALHHQAHLPGSAGIAGVASWQLALALFASSVGGGSSRGGSEGGSIRDCLMKLTANEAMAAAMAACTPATARCCWLLLRLLLDEQQRQGGHRLAEAERQLAVRVAHEAVRRPQAAAALASTLCSLSPTAAAGQQLLVEVENMLRHPVVTLQQAATTTAPPPVLGAKPQASNAASGTPAPPLPLPFAGEQGLVEAALVCLSTGSSGERQHAFAQQLIKQLAALADVALGEPGQAAQPALLDGGGYGPHGPAASPAAVQVSAWLRLALLLPLLPLVYKHRSSDASGGLRGQLLRALLRLLASPAVRADAAANAAALQGAIDGREAATAAAAAAAAGEPLAQRLLHLVRALLVGGWASWMRLQGGKLRDVPAYEHSRQLAAEVATLPLPPHLQAAVTAALPMNQQQGLADVAACRVHAACAAAAVPGSTATHCGVQQQQGNIGGSSGSSSDTAMLSLDPWLLLEGGTDGSGSSSIAPGTDGLAPALLPAGAAASAMAQAPPPPWLLGAVKRRRRDLSYMPAPSVPTGSLSSIEEQLQHRSGATGTPRF